MVTSVALLFSACGARAEPAAKVMENPRMIPAASAAAALSAAGSRVLLVDVRTEEEYAAGHIPGAVLFPYDRLETSAADFSAIAGGKDRPVIVYCRSGRRSAIAAQSLVKLGYTDVSDLGGISSWTGPLEQ